MDKPFRQDHRLSDPQAIEALVHRYQGGVYRLCISILGDPADAEDAVQETFIAAVKALEGFRGQSAFTTWLHAIAVNACRQLLKRQRRHRKLRDALAARQPILADPPDDPERTLLQRDASERLWQAVSALPEKHRLSVILRYYHDLPIAEIARLLGVREGTVHSRLSHARERLRGLMARGWTLKRERR
jgi:RNA polymerase sigma-70 factor (ECF subfamily)